MDSNEVFIEGEMVELCVPSLSNIERDGWGKWFNDKNTTKFLQRGVFPNFPQEQIDFFKSLQSHSRLSLMIQTKKTNKIIGTISLSAIDWVARSAQISIVVSQKTSTPLNLLYSLESMALISEHGFQYMGLNRIWAGQAYPGLKNWCKCLEILGYRTEGVLRNGFIKGRNVSDTVIISCLFEDYEEITESRGGKYWLGRNKMKEIIRELPDRGFAEILAEVIHNEAKVYFDDIP